ncbi:FAD-binding protein [Seongchinamella sediminis]|uniref:FAD-binding protein n=2 Tax=Seongchinamella sediminis TaxID=2283635 RepID=A0A3L7DRM2_9GAMM|nr:FAD-binding protein [Seongchinamella sediminis]
MCAAARLSAENMKVALVEKSPYLGGRCGHRERQDCKVTTGALMIPMGPASAIRQAFDAVGAEMDMIDLTGRMRYRLDHGDYDLPPDGGGLYGMLEFAMGDADQAKALMGHIQDALFHWTPLNTITIRDWFDQYTDNQAVKNLFQGYCAALMGINLHEIPAGEFFRFLKFSSKGTRFGMAREGNGALMATLAAAMEQRGATILRQTGCKRILVEDGRVTGVVVNNSEGQDQTLRADLVLSNTGPDRTVALAGGESLFERSYVEQLHTDACDAPIMHTSFVMDRPLIEDFNGCMVFGNTTNFIYLEIPSEISPDISPAGKYLHTAYGAPADAANPDLAAEFRNTLAELEENFPGVSEEATFLVKAKHRGPAPAMHRWIGRGMPVNTPIRGLYNVGDGCAPSGTIGTESAAASAREAVAMILAQAR